jgi:hypothetical protein
VKTPLAIHRDDRGGVKYPVETCIIYTHKDPTIQGGNIEFWDEAPSTIDWLMNCMGCSSFSSAMSVEIPVETGLILLMGGDVYHKPQDVSGNGTRNCVVVQLRSKKERA